MPRGVSKGKPTTRRYSPEERAAAVRMVRALRAELPPMRYVSYRLQWRLATDASAVAGALF